MKPAVLNGLPGGIFVAPIAGKHARAPHEDFTIGGELNLLWIERQAGIAGLRKRFILA